MADTNTTDDVGTLGARATGIDAGNDGDADAAGATAGAGVEPAVLINPKTDIAALAELERHLYAHRYAQIGIACYGSSIDPAAAAADRGEAQAILEEEDQALLCSPLAAPCGRASHPHPSRRGQGAQA